MQIDIYNRFYQQYFSSKAFATDFSRAMEYLAKARNIFFIGNGGSNAVCSHMMEDYAKIGGFRTFGFSDPALITCFANDYGYDKAMAEWLKIYFAPGDMLVAVSSSGNSPNILRASEQALNMKGILLTLTGFREDNKLRSMGAVNFHLPVENYGVVECFHQVILHAMLDEYAKAQKRS